MTKWLQQSTAALTIAVFFYGCGSSYDATCELNKELIRQFVDAGNSRDYDQVKTLLTPGFTRHCQATPDVSVNSAEEFIAFMRNDAEVFPVSQVTIKHLVAEDSLVAIWATYAGTQDGQMGPFPPSHKRMEVDFGGVFRVEEGKLAELWVTWDNLAALTQLGYFPPPAPDSL